MREWADILIVIGIRLLADQVGTNNAVCVALSNAISLSYEQNDHACAEWIAHAQNGSCMRTTAHVEQKCMWNEKVMTPG